LSVENESWLVVARTGDYASNALVVGRIARPHGSIIVQNDYGTGVNCSSGCIELFGAIAILKNDVDAYPEGIANLDIPVKAPGETFLAEPNNTGAINAIALHPRPAAATAKDAKAFASIAAVDASIDITRGLSNNASPRASPQHASAAFGKTNHAISISASKARYPVAPVVIGTDHTTGVPYI